MSLCTFSFDGWDLTPEEIALFLADLESIEEWALRINVFLLGNQQVGLA